MNKVTRWFELFRSGLFCLLICLMVVGCGSVEVKRAAWIDDPYAVQSKIAEKLGCTEFIVGVGSSPFANDRMISLARRNAESQGRAVIGNAIQTEISDAVKNFAEHTESGGGSDLEMVISNTTKQLTERLKLAGALALLYYKEEGESNVYALVATCATEVQIVDELQKAMINISGAENLDEESEQRIYQQAKATFDGLVR